MQEHRTATGSTNKEEFYIMGKHRKRDIPGELLVDHIEAKLAQEFTFRALQAAQHAPRTEILNWSGGVIQRDELQRMAAASTRRWDGVLTRLKAQS